MCLAWTDIVIYSGLFKKQTFLRSFLSLKHSTLVTDALPNGIGAVVQQDGDPTACFRPAYCCRRVIPTHNVKRLQFIDRFNDYTSTCPVLSSHLFPTIRHYGLLTTQSTAVKVQRWCIGLSAYDYDVQDRSAKQILYAEDAPRYAKCLDSRDSDCLPVQPLPISCQD